MISATITATFTIAGSDPLYEQLARAIGGAIERGEVPAGTRLPSERDFAAHLGVSHTTIVGAYDQLRATDIVRSRQGSGTRVSGRPGVAAATGLAAGHGGHGLIQPSALTDTIALTLGALRGWSGIRDVIEETIREDLAELVNDFGYLPFGLPSLRSAIAQHLGALGVPTTPDEVLVTSGAQQGLHLLADQLVGHDGLVAIEDPTYVGAVDALHAVGARMVSVPVGPDGMRIDALRAVLAGASPSFVYVVPTYHNPTGAVMPEPARRELARLAQARGVLIVEDLTPAMGTSERVPAPIGSFAAPGRVISLGSASKFGWGGLRIGWIRADRQLITQLAVRKTAIDHGSSVLSQAVAARVLGHVAAFGDHAARQSGLRRVLVAEALTRHLPEWEWTLPKGGLSFWVRLPNADATAFARLAADHGVIVRPGPFASPNGGFRDHIRIAVGDDPERLTEGIERLARAWAEYQPSGARRESAVVCSV